MKWGIFDADWDLWGKGIVGKKYKGGSHLQSQHSWCRGRKIITNFLTVYGESDAIDYIVTPCLTKQPQNILCFLLWRCKLECHSSHDRMNIESPTWSDWRAWFYQSNQNSIVQVLILLHCILTALQAELNTYIWSLIYIVFPNNK